MKNVISDMKSLFEGLNRKLGRAEKIKQSKISNGMGKIWMKTVTNFPETSPDGVAQGTVILATNCDNKHEAVPAREPGLSLDVRDFYVEVSHTSTLCLDGSSEKVGVHHEPPYLCK